MILNMEGGGYEIIHFNLLYTQVRISNSFTSMPLHHSYRYDNIIIILLFPHKDKLKVSSRHQHYLNITRYYQYYTRYLLSILFVTSKNRRLLNKDFKKS